MVKDHQWRRPGKSPGPDEGMSRNASIKNKSPNKGQRVNFLSLTHNIGGIL